MDLLEDMVGARWRLRRIAVIQTERLDMQVEHHIEAERGEADNQSPTRLQAHAFGRAVNIERSMDVLLRYEVTYSRMYDRAMETLERIQKVRPEPRRPPNNPSTQPGPTTPKRELRPGQPQAVLERMQDAEATISSRSTGTWLTTGMPFTGKK